MLYGALAKRSGVSISELRAAVETGCCAKTTRFDLHFLIRQGVVRSEGKGRWTRYYLVKD